MYPTKPSQKQLISSHFITIVPKTENKDFIFMDYRNIPKVGIYRTYMSYIPLLYAIGKIKSPPHVQAHLLLRPSAAKELSLPHRHPHINTRIKLTVF
jgi:hypothetical protein